VSVDRTQQRGKGHTEGCPEQLTVRRISPWHWTVRRDDGHKPGSGRRWAVAELPARVGRARERARGLGRGRKWERRGGRAGRVAQKGAGARTWPENARSWARPRWGDRGREVRDEMTGGDGGAERERAGAREDVADKPGPRGSEREGERGRAGLRRQAGPTCQAQGARRLG
jgi:hypothetical protein